MAWFGCLEESEEDTVGILSGAVRCGIVLRMIRRSKPR